MYLSDVFCRRVTVAEQGRRSEVLKTSERYRLVNPAVLLGGEAVIKYIQVVGVNQTSNFLRSSVRTVDLSFIRHDYLQPTASPSFTPSLETGMTRIGHEACQSGADIMKGIIEPRNRW